MTGDRPGRAATPPPSVPGRSGRELCHSRGGKGGQGEGG